MISAKFIVAALVGEVFGSERCGQAACQRSGAFASAPVMIDAWMAAMCSSGVVHPRCWLIRAPPITTPLAKLVVE
jgi:hypothetical protein